jgi:hypothetical protein
MPEQYADQCHLTVSLQTQNETIWMCFTHIYIFNLKYLKDILYMLSTDSQYCFNKNST